MKWKVWEKMEPSGRRQTFRQGWRTGHGGKEERRGLQATLPQQGRGSLKDQQGRHSTMWTADGKGGQEAGRETGLQKRPPEHGLGWRDQTETHHWGRVHSTQPGTLWEAGCESFLGGTRRLPTSQITNSSSGARNLLAAPLGSTFCSAPCHILAQGSLEPNASRLSSSPAQRDNQSS